MIKKPKPRHAVFMVLILSLLITGELIAAQGETTIVSVVVGLGSGYEVGNDNSGYASISADGRYVAFVSFATNLVPNETNYPNQDVFVYDRLTGQTTTVSVNSEGVQGDDLSSYPSISADGRYVAFASAAANLVPEHGSCLVDLCVEDIYVHDRQTGQTTRVSLNSAGEPGNDYSYYPSISADGRYVAFHSTANNLVPDDTNEVDDIFIHDRQTGQTTRVSVSSEGAQGNANSNMASISADGRYVAFGSGASNLILNDTSGVGGIFVHDLQTGQTTKVSVSSEGVPGNAPSGMPSISADGRSVAFVSWANNLVPNDTSGFDVFVHDRQTGQTTRVSVSSAGVQQNGDTFNLPIISADGRYVAFCSYASNLVANDTNEASDIFVHDRQTGQTKRANVDSNGLQGNMGAHWPSISSDGRYVAFESWSSNLVPNDTNEASDVFVHDFLGDSFIADFDTDGDVDGSDLAHLILGNETIDIASFALNFGRGS